MCPKSALLTKHLKEPSNPDTPCNYGIYAYMPTLTETNPGLRRQICQSHDRSWKRRANGLDPVACAHEITVPLGDWIPTGPDWAFSSGFGLLGDCGCPNRSRRDARVREIGARNLRRGTRVLPAHAWQVEVLHLLSS